MGWDQGVLEDQALTWRSENDLGESVSPSTMQVQGNLTPGQWQLSVLTGPSRWCIVWFWRQGLTVVQDGLSWTGWLQPPSSWNCRHHYYTQIATWYFPQRLKRTVQHREHWRARCLVTGTSFPGVLGSCLNLFFLWITLCLQFASGWVLRTWFQHVLLSVSAWRWVSHCWIQPATDQRKHLYTTHGLFLLTISQQSSTFVQCPSHRRCK